MKTAIILEADHLGISVSDLLNPANLKLVGIGNSYPDTWNVFENEETGELKDKIEGIPVMPIDLAVTLQPDVLVIAASNEEKSHALEYMAIRAGFENDIIFVNTARQHFTAAGAAIRRLTRRLHSLGIPGSMAELGCFQGDLSWQLNALMPDRKLYLFDTFQGYDPRDLKKEEEIGGTKTEEYDFKDVKPELVMARMPEKEQVILKEGWFPETALDLEDETYALVILDAGLYQPTYAGMEYFFPRMSRGGVILVCNYESTRYTGVRRAMDDLEKKYGAFLVLPVGDLDGTVMIVHP
ncbi:TylF/MycF/NovP-related O-methyltransferase [Lacrimispora sp. 210928-DFI.3.58]|uniref:TylF/MycF/NovP-related O-methyltransferase n=1 Tax=Lacrimispora sp. 210928-DFI.3.58 TaxID=2883214 RepID=UPI0015B784E3|nr:TylF/MycF/NovP-related O-methyltransferase [Lacrimispora sp. 210928-DFI.3.58]MCB7320701.1 TylF/MycF family methyltransferase [Lacrimispora sp. 210928-DFI.3.58]